MEEVQCHHTMKDLFAQLGLPDESNAIRAFVAAHRPLANDVRLPDAPFWSPSQAAFLRLILRKGGEWALVVDTLSALLRDYPETSELQRAAA